MWAIARALAKAGVELFRTPRDRLLVLGLVLLSATVSVAELATAKLFSALILPHGEQTRAEFIELAVLFFVVFGLLRLTHYVQAVYQVSVFEKAFSRGKAVTGKAESWRWATAMELVSILTGFARLLAISVAMFFFAPIFGVVNVIAAVVLIEWFGHSFKRQWVIQQGFKVQEKTAPIPNAVRVRARIKSGAFASLLASIAVMGLLAVLIGLRQGEQVAAGTAIVIFFAVRMEGQIYTGLSTGLMRFARARVNSLSRSAESA